jgi:hypothetical protein
MKKISRKNVFLQDTHTLSLTGSVTNNEKTTVDCPPDFSMVRTLGSNVADPGCLSRIPYPGFFHPEAASKNLSI